MPKNTLFYVDGPFFVYGGEKKIEYCVFSTKSKHNTDEIFIDQRSMYNYENLHNDLFDIGEKFNIHQQVDQTILAMAVLEENTQNLVSAWLNHLQTKNPTLNEASILVRLIENDKSTEIQIKNKNE